MVCTFNVPDDNHFQVIGEYALGTAIVQHAEDRVLGRTRDHPDHFQRRLPGYGAVLMGWRDLPKRVPAWHCYRPTAN
jgi:hypothetical protein